MHVHMCTGFLLLMKPLKIDHRLILLIQHLNERAQVNWLLSTAFIGNLMGLP